MSSKGTKSVALMVSGIGVAIILCIGGVVAIAAPKFMRFQDRSLQSECKSQLRAIATAERAYYSEFDRYSSKLSDLGLIVEKGNRYQYRVGSGPMGVEAIPVDSEKVPGATSAQYDAYFGSYMEAQVGLRGTCPDCALTATCVGNVDSDATLDVWSVTVSVKRDGELFTPVAGELINHVDDTAF